ncbi:MAG: AraC family transcriptional regulator [bacterium]|nr:AraC family transcriptional regulator [bacterium]
MKKIWIYEQTLDILTKAEIDDFSYLTIGWIARKLGVSQTYLSRSFTEFQRLPIYTYITCKKISRAAKLLEEQNDMTVKEMANAVHFYSAGHFSRLWKRMFGISPHRYKQCLKRERGSNN